MLLYYANASDGAGVTPSTQDPSWPAVNVQNDQRVRVWKTLGTQTTETLTITLSSPMAVTAFLAHYHNFDGTETNVLIQGNASNVWTSPAFSIAVPWTAITMGVTFASQTYQYWQFTFTKASSASIRSVGRIFLGTYQDTTQAGDPDFDGLEVALTDASVVDKNIFGQTYTEQRGQYHAFKLSSTYVPDAIQTYFRNVFAAVGTWKCWFIQIRTTAPYSQWYYVLFQGSLPEKPDGFDTSFYWATALALEEQL